MLLQNPPTPLNGVVLAVIGRKVQQLNGCADVVAKRHHSVQKLCASPTILRAVIHLDLDQLYVVLLQCRHCVPPVLKVINHEVTRFEGIAKGDV